MMLCTRLWVMCFCGILCLSTLAHCNKQQDKTLKKDTTSEQSTIYNVKQLEAKDRFTDQQQPPKQQIRQKQKHQQQKQLQHDEQQIQLLTKQHKLHQQQQQQLQHQQLHSLGAAAKMEIDGKQRRVKKFKNSTKTSHGLNKKLLNKLGFTKVKAPNSHNRKRLAVESRRHASPDDSHMFIIKLPPNMYYYSNPKSNNGNGNANDNTNKNSLLPTTSTTKQSADIKSEPAGLQSKEMEALNTNGKKVSFPFNSNGRPGRIYHWNLPVIKKILDDKQRFAHIAKTTKEQLIDIKNAPTWAKPWENDTAEKSYSKAHYKKSLKRKSPSYYAPVNAVNKNSFNKYFAGNGKPKGFYVIKENQKKPLFYKNIIS